jgi:hypothetical protein
VNHATYLEKGIKAHKALSEKITKPDIASSSRKFQVTDQNFSSLLHHYYPLNILKYLEKKKLVVVRQTSITSFLTRQNNRLASLRMQKR